jgi:putative 7-cyano-7-deazaguanosine (preQ0) biosynthesis protein QueE
VTNPQFITEPSNILANRFRGYFPVVIDVETAGFNASTDALLEIAVVMTEMDSDGLLRPADTLHFHIEPFEGANLEKSALDFIKSNYSANHIVITGGEPCMYDLCELTDLLAEQGYTSQIETSGTFEVKTNPETWVTVSPKVNMKGGYDVLKSAIDRADEIKHPIAMQKHVDELDELLEQADSLEDKIICLQPISQKPNATKLAIDICIKRNWRLSVQSHKYIGIA